MGRIIIFKFLSTTTFASNRCFLGQTRPYVVRALGRTNGKENNRP